MASDPITSGNKEIEDALRGLQPSALPTDFLDRLESVANAEQLDLTDAEIRFEQSLRGHKPTALSADFFGKLEDVIKDVPFPINDKIVLFPKTAPLQKTKSRPAYRPWAAAAAVALIGGFSALLLPDGKQTSPPVVANNPREASASPINRPSSGSSNIVPAGTNPQADVQDMGVSWHESGQPHRVLRLTYRGKVVIKNPDGSVLEVEQPQPEYIIIPEKMD